jgi:hypothetical protein
MVNEGKIKEIEERWAEEDAYNQLPEDRWLAPSNAEVACQLGRKQNDGEQECELQE